MVPILTIFSVYVLAFSGAPILIFGTKLNGVIPALIIRNPHEVAYKREKKLMRELHTNIGDYMWVVYVRAYSVFFSESRLLAFIHSGVVLGLSFLFLFYDSKYIGYLVAGMVCLLPFALNKALVCIVYFGKAIDIHDSDFKKVMCLCVLCYSVIQKYRVHNHGTANSISATPDEIASAMAFENSSQKIRKSISGKQFSFIAEREDSEDSFGFSSSSSEENKSIASDFTISVDDQQQQDPRQWIYTDNNKDDDDDESKESMSIISSFSSRYSNKNSHRDDSQLPSPAMSEGSDHGEQHGLQQRHLSSSNAATAEATPSVISSLNSSSSSSGDEESSSDSEEEILLYNLGSSSGHNISINDCGGWIPSPRQSLHNSSDDGGSRISDISSLSHEFMSFHVSAADRQIVHKSSMAAGGTTSPTALAPKGASKAERSDMVSSEHSSQSNISSERGSINAWSVDSEHDV